VKLQSKEGRVLRARKSVLLSVPQSKLAKVFGGGILLPTEANGAVLVEQSFSDLQNLVDYLDPTKFTGIERDPACYPKAVEMLKFWGVYKKKQVAVAD
jgi:hypothetical protein